MEAGWGTPGAPAQHDGPSDEEGYTWMPLTACLMLSSRSLFSGSW